MRPFRFVLHLKDFGWEPTVLTIAAPGQRMTLKEKRLLSEIEIIELHPPFDRTSSSESQLGAKEHTGLHPYRSDAASSSNRADAASPSNRSDALSSNRPDASSPNRSDASSPNRLDASSSNLSDVSSYDRSNESSSNRANASASTRADTASTSSLTRAAPLEAPPPKGLGARLLETFDRQFPTDTWLLLFAAKYGELRRIVRRVQPDVIWCTGDPWSGLVVARDLAEHFDIPWVADFRDPWTLSEIRSEGQWTLSRRADAFFERKIIESADVVLFQAESVEDAYRRHYDDVDFKTRTITNSFDPNVFDDPIAFDATRAMPASPTDGLHVGFFGRFRSMSPAALIIDALSAVRGRNPNLAGRIHIHSFGSLNQADAAYAIEHGVASSFVSEDAVPLEKALSALREFDLLLVSTDVSREHIIPAKVFEYLAAGRPILSLSRNAEVGSILERTGTGVQLDPLQPETVADFLVRCLEACDQGRRLPIPFQPDAAAISRYEASETTRLLAQLFDEITADPA